jgi:inorganic pyrophosphatase
MGEGDAREFAARSLRDSLRAPQMFPVGCADSNGSRLHEMQILIDNPTVDGDVPVSQLEVDVVIEVPRGSFLKRGSTGQVDFISPFPCPFNYGSVPAYIGLEGDLLDALALGPRLAFGACIRVTAWGAVTLTDRGMTDDKLICSSHRITAAERRMVLRFFDFHARCKGLLSIWRRCPGC